MKRRMHVRGTLLVLAGLLVATLAGSVSAEGPAPPTVRFTLEATLDGRTVSPGTTIEWEARLRAPSSGNEGLAFVSFDLVQDESNPLLFDLPPAGRAPDGMTAFDRPAGFANPSHEDPWGSGYGGTSVGDEGRRNLTQIGGAQNTFGVAPSCHGPDDDICMGQDTAVLRGIGHSGTGQLVARGSFDAPDTAGTYRIRVREVVAGLIVKINVAPQPSVVVPADVRIMDDELSFTVR